MNSYVLIQGEYIENGWFEKVDKYTFSKVEEMSKRFTDSTTSHFLNGKPGLTLDRVEKFSQQHMNNIISWLNEGKTLLMNIKGGIMLLTEDIHILREVKQDRFPLQENLGLSGWLSPEGKFHPCEYGEHHMFAQHNPKAKGYVKLGVDLSKPDNSYVFVENKLTEKQKDWFSTYQSFLDNGQSKAIQRYIK